MHRMLLRSALLAAAVMAAPIQADSADTGLTFSGTVRHQGRPVAGAAVALMQAYAVDGQDEPPARTTADAAGRFTLALPTGDAARRRCVVARDGHGRLGWLEFFSETELHLEPALRVELHDVGEARGRLTDAAGAPLPRVPVQALSLNLARAGDETRRGFGLPPALAKGYETVTGDDGSFVLRGVPAGGSVGAKLTVPGHGGSLNVVWDQDRPCDLRLEKPGTIRVRFDGATDPQQLAGLQVYLYRQPGPDGSVRLFAPREVKAAADRELVIDDVYPGRYQLTPHLTPTVPYVPEPPPAFDVRPGAATAVTVSLQPAVWVRGRVIDRRTKQGVAGLQLNIGATSERGYREFITWATTDADGRYRVAVRPGRLSVAVGPLLRPSEYLPPRDAAPAEPVAAGAEHTFPDIALEPAARAEGVVVDAAGRPLAGVVVRTAHDADQHNIAPPLTDAAGRFTLRHLDPADFTVLRARTATAVTEQPVQLEVAKQQGPIKLVLTEAAAFRLRGRVVDAANKPVADAAVRVEWRYPGVGRNSRMGYGAWLGTYRTDADGRFETLALWPGDQYRVGVTADGFGPAESSLVRGAAGQVHDLGAITLPRTGTAVAGRVVDAAGKPLAGVRVFNDGDAAQPLATTTAADGRFRLEGLFDGPVYVFARRDGFRFTAVRTSAGDAAVTVTLPKADAPPPADQPAARPPGHEAAERKLTRHLLERVWALPRGVTGGFESYALRGMLRLDPDQARRWLAEERERAAPGARADENWVMNRLVRIADAERVAADDADDALAQLAPLRAEHAFPVLLRLAERFRETDIAKAQRFTEEAAVRARALDLPERVWSLAEVGGVVVRLGKPVEGRKLLSEAVDLADKLGGQRLQGYARGRVAVVLAAFDLDRAKALVQPVEDRERQRWLANIAVHLAEHDLDQALAVLKDLKPDGSSIGSLSRWRIAQRLAAAKPAEAVRVAESIPLTIYRAEALAGVAARIGGRDPALARTLIDRALALCLDQPEEFRSWSNFGGRTTAAAWVAYEARRAGYADMASVTARVLATRPTSRYGHSPRDVAETLVKAAAALSLSDPGTARLVLAQAAPPAQPLSPELTDRREWLFACALADPERAVALVDRRIEAAKQSATGLSGSGLTELCQLLSAPPGPERVRLLSLYGSVGLMRDED